MRIPSILLWLAAASALPGATLARTGAVVQTDQVRAEMLAHAPDGVTAGKPFRLGLKIEHQPHWHTYWKNPGDSGLPTTLQWTLPGGALAGEIEWPTPKALPLGPLVNFGYEGTLLLPVTVTLPSLPAGETLDIRLRADWLVCKDVCIPEGGDFELRLPLNAAIGAHGGLFDAARAALPRPVPGAVREVRFDGGAMTVTLTGLPAAWQGRTLTLLPELAGVIDNAARQTVRWSGSDVAVSVPLLAQRSASPASLPLVLLADGLTPGLRATASVTAAWPAVGAVTAAALPPTASGPASASVQPSLLVALLLAIAGGLLLNLMPCVFPVLSLKLIGVAQCGQDRRRLRVTSLAYAAGVVVGFVALAGLMLALRAGGEQLGWGFQLQSPGFVAALAALFTLIGLNLAGVFEIGNLLPARLASFQARHPVADSALTGLLAVAVASPCTAPFMGAALGLATTLEAAPALTIFAALGLGMALPLVLASIWPSLARVLPRPGPWMVHFKTLMAFPMFATVVWLVWVLGQQVGVDGAAALLGLLVALAFVAWALGTPTLGRGARWAFGAASLALLAATLLWALPSLRSGAEAAAPGRTAAADAWEPWSPARVEQALAQGQPVFVDFTAAWCVTCQFNKRTTLADVEVRAAFERKNVLRLRADWTRRDAAITAELARLGRSGVPVYVLQRPGGAPAHLFGEILTPSELTTALADLP